MLPLVKQNQKEEIKSEEEGYGIPILNRNSEKEKASSCCSLSKKRCRTEIELRDNNEELTARTRNLMVRKLSEQRQHGNNEIGKLRKESRNRYVGKRVGKCLIEQNDALRINKEVYELAINCRQEDNNTNEYKMPEAYDTIGVINQEKRFSVAKEKYRDPQAGEKMNSFAEQNAWEDNQIGKATLKFGSKDGKNSQNEYNYVFKDQIDLIKLADLDTNQFKNQPNKHQAAKTITEKLQEQRKTLPIYPYKSELLKALELHQILIIVGETGSGKTTQIPQYLHESGYTKKGIVACTQPRRVAAMSVASRVSQEMGVKLGHEIGYSIRFEDYTSDKTVIKYMTDGRLLKEFCSQPDLKHYSVVMIDEAHERTVWTDILFALLKDIAKSRKDLKLLISSATLDAKKFSDYFDDAPIFYIPGRKYEVEIFHTESPESDYLQAALETVLRIHVKEPAGDILVFLTGQEEIETVEEMLKYKMKKFGKKISEMIICPIYANLPTDLQTKIFEPAPAGARKVVLATNIAETSVTIDGIKYVIDPGFCKIKTFNPRTRMESLLINPISKASANQRAGRAGRTGPGKCFRLYTKESFNSELEENTIPEILRTNLTNIVLILKSIGIDDLANFDFMDPPPILALISGLEQLYALNALNHKGELTLVGRKMAELPSDPMLSKMIVASEKYKCTEEILTIAAMISVGNSVFYRPKNKQMLADSARMIFHSGNVGDHIALLNVYNSWKETDYSTQWCYENYIQVKSMRKARDIRDQLEGLVKNLEIEIHSNLNDFDSIKKAITSGFFLNAAKLEKNGSYKTLKIPQKVYIHPSSGLVEVLPRWVIYHELVLTKKEYMRYVTELKPEWLSEICPNYYEVKEIDDLAIKKMPRGQGRSALKD
ncbi:hypothetical protein LUZ60_017545 [Juncus effusus]|nr:hypothetical protein LUZ60_017545 [Juncus effusus]